MARQSHALDHMLGRKMASTLPIRPRRKSEDELRRMTIEDRLLYQMREPEMTDAEKYEALEMEDLRYRLGMSDNELSWQDYDRLSDTALGED